MQTDKLLPSRDRFREAVCERDRHRCVRCGASGVPLDAHHILERKLWPDGGYYLANGATLCGACHLLAEQTDLGVEEVRRLCGITRAVVPAQFHEDERIDKWGNPILPNKQRLRGELFWDDGVQTALAAHLHLFTRFVKPPRTFHLPFSQGRTKDDVGLSEADLSYLSDRRVVITEKLDGECTAIWGPDGYAHARSTDPLRRHPSRGRVKALAERIGRDIPKDWRVVGENVTAMHSIHYTHLAPHEHWYFRPFGIWDERNRCLPWDETEEWCEMLGLLPVPVLYRGRFDHSVLRTLPYDAGTNGDEREGFVVRDADGFPFALHRRAVAKYVRSGHNQCGDDWESRPVVYNRPAQEA